MPDFDLFISYSRADRQTVEPLAQRLRAAGLSVYLDRWYLAPGTNWLTALESTLARCRAVAVCAGNELGAWQQREVHAALERQVEAERCGSVFPVIPVLLHADAAPLGFLGQNTWVDLTVLQEDEALAMLVRAARGEPPGPDLLDAVAQAKAAVCPYRGLLYFREEDAPLFHGREAAIARLLDTVDRHRLVAVVGDSGSGKSSVVRAGLLPALHRRRDDAWEMLTIVPGDRPFQRLAAELVQVLEPDADEVSQLLQGQKLGQALESGDIRLRDIAERVLQRQPGTRRLLLVVDQWEELFTLTESALVRQAFIDNLLDATAAAQSPLSVVLTLRGDYFGRAITSQRQLADRLQGAQVNLGPMTLDELRSAIVSPARQVGLEFEANLVDLIIEHATAEPGNLPLLEFVLRELWEQRRGRLLHREAYDAMGELKGAIANRADAVFKRLTQQHGDDKKAEQRVKLILLRLVRPGDGQPDTRRRAPLADLDAPSRALVEQLAAERLVVTAGPGGDGDTVEVAHEALIVQWTRLRDWVQADRDFVTWRLSLDDAMQQWDRGHKAADLLPRGIVLTTAQDWLARRRDELSDREVQFIAAAARRQTLWRVGVSAVATLAVAGALWFAVVAGRERSRADGARERAEQLVDYMLFDLRDRLEPVGRLDLMASINDKVAAYYRHLSDADSDASRHRRWAALANQGYVHFAQGRLDAAHGAYEQAQAIAQGLAAADASNAGWQRDLSVSHERLGDVEVASGRLDAARKDYERNLALVEQLANADSANVALQRDLSTGYSKLGDVEVAANRPGAARRAYEQALVIQQRLAQADPSNTDWQRGLSISHDKLGDVEVVAGDPEAARKAYEQSLAIAERLAQVDASNTDWQRDLSVSYGKLGNMEVSAGRLDSARKAYERSLGISERLVRADASNTQWQRDVSVSHMQLGILDKDGGKPSAAAERFQKSLAISARLVALDPSNATWKNDLDEARTRLAAAARQRAGR